MAPSATDGHVTVLNCEKDQTKHEEEETIIDYDGPDDVGNPLNWSATRKWVVLASLCIITFTTSLASSMFAPAISLVLADFHNDSIVLSALVISIYILGYATGPFLIAPLSELYGRSMVYYTTDLLFIVFTVACAVSSSIGMLVVFRFFEGVAGCCASTIGAATIADMFPQEQRGRAISIWSAGSLIGPILGPVCGGFLSQALGWRWVFWLLSIVGAAGTLFQVVVLRETYAPAILQRKARRLSKDTGAATRSKLGDTSPLPQKLKNAFVRPLKMLLHPIIGPLSLYNAVVYAYVYLLFTTFGTVFQEQYDFSIGISGLAYLGVGIGELVSLLLYGLISDRYVKRKAAVSGEMKPEYRLPPMVVSGVAIPVGLLIYGWSAQYKVQWFVPILGTFFIGAGMISVMIVTSTYCVDSFRSYAASALAATAVLRSLVGAFLPLAGPAMYSTLGLGWGNTILALIAVIFIPIPWAFYWYGERLRALSRFKFDF